MEKNIYYIKGKGNTFREQLESLFATLKAKELIIRLVFFGNSVNNMEYATHLSLITQEVKIHFREKLPVFSYVAQPSLDGNLLIVEVFLVKLENYTQVFFNQRNDLHYILIDTKTTKELFLGGIRGNSLKDSIRKQSDTIFSKLKDIFSFEKMPVSSIVRQWNYIEQITKIKGGTQNYQSFNDSRTRFYDSATWENGYPAATGIGTSCGGVIVDIDAMQIKNASVKIISLNNKLQVPAHAYSQNVLIGKTDHIERKKTTPKFERAKLVFNNNHYLLIISGTAAIRNETSLQNINIEEQAKKTLENIEYLFSDETLKDSGINNYVKPKICSLRIYVKHESLVEKIKKIVNESYSGVPAAYLKADICREELLVEIEGFARLNTDIKCVN